MRPDSLPPPETALYPPLPPAPPGPGPAALAAPIAGRGFRERLRLGFALVSTTLLVLAGIASPLPAEATPPGPGAAPRIASAEAPGTGGATSPGERSPSSGSLQPRPSASEPAAPVAAPRQAGAAVLTVVVEGLRSDAGTVAFALYGSEADFVALENPVRKARLPIAGRACRWRLEDLPPGDYVLSVYHDADGDGELDKGAFGIPTEPYGFSNDARGVTGPPSWEKARFRHGDGSREMRVRVR